MTYGVDLQVRNLVEDAGVMVWEGGAKTTPDIKRDIVALLDRVDSLVAIVDLKAAERPDEPKWWPSLAVVHAWIEEDPFFAKAIDRWRHARQERLLEAVIWDLNAGNELTKGQLQLLKERVKFTSAVLPLTVNKGMRQKVDVETTNNHLHLHASLSDEALAEKMAQLRRNPRVREFLCMPMDDGASTPTLIEAVPLDARPAPVERPSIGQDLMGSGL